LLFQKQITAYLQTQLQQLSLDLLGRLVAYKKCLRAKLTTPIGLQ
jgi:hypothetical protein